MFPRDNPALPQLPAGASTQPGTAGASGAPAPPAFGASGAAAKKRPSGASSGFGSTILGLGSAPAQTGTKTLLGQ